MECWGDHFRKKLEGWFKVNILLSTGSTNDATELWGSNNADCNVAATFASPTTRTQSKWIRTLIGRECSILIIYLLYIVSTGESTAFNPMSATLLGMWREAQDLSVFIVVFMFEWLVLFFTQNIATQEKGRQGFVETADTSFVSSHFDWTQLFLG